MNKAIPIVGLIVIAIIAISMASAGAKPTTKTSPYDHSPAAQAQQPASRPAPNQPPITEQGQGTESSNPFRLDGGTYTFSWTASDTNSYGCYHGGFLKSTTGDYMELIGNDMVPDGGTRNGHTIVRNVPQDTYYLDMNSGCRWSVTIAPLQ